MLAECPVCGSQVVPMQDGTCPACRQQSTKWPSPTFEQDTAPKPEPSREPEKTSTPEGTAGDHDVKASPRTETTGASIASKSTGAEDFVAVSEVNCETCGALCPGVASFCPACGEKLDGGVLPGHAWQDGPLAATSGGSRRSLRLLLLLGLPSIFIAFFYAQSQSSDSIGTEEGTSVNNENPVESKKPNGQSDLLKTALDRDSPAQQRKEAMNEIVDLTERHGISFLAQCTKMAAELPNNLSDPQRRTLAVMQQVADACQTIAEGERKRMTQAMMMPVVTLADHPQLRHQFGQLKEFKVSWRSTSQEYKTDSWGNVTAHGEDITCAIRFENFLTVHHWWTDFPREMLVKPTERIVVSVYINPLERIFRNALGQLPDESLSAFARDTESEIRQLAVLAISDPALLVEHQEYLIELTSDRFPEDTRYEAIRRITDQERLAELAQSPEDRIRFGAIDNIKDQALLARIAKEDKEGYIRGHAAEKLTDQNALAEIVLATGEGWKETYVHQAAVGAMTDKDLLAKVAERLSYYDRSSINERIAQLTTDQNELAKMATSHLGQPTRSAALKQIKDQALLSRIATTDKDPYVRAAALTNLTDQKILAKLAWEGGDSKVRVAAIENLEDQQLLTKIALKTDWNRWGDYVSETRRAAIKRLKSQELLGEIALDKEDTLAASEASARISSREILLRIAMDDRITISRRRDAARRFNELVKETRNR